MGAETAAIVASCPAGANDPIGRLLWGAICLESNDKAEGVEPIHFSTYREATAAVVRIGRTEVAIGESKRDALRAFIGRLTATLEEAQRQFDAEGYGPNTPDECDQRWDRTNGWWPNDDEATNG